jgi:ribose transport system substrate-binding protein
VRAAAKSNFVVALDNGYTGNYWRLNMIKTWEDAAKVAEAEGLISGTKIENTPDNSATEQISTMKALILENVSAITIDSASGTALNSVIDEACAAGIIVVAFDSLASAPCEYNLSVNYEQLGEIQTQYVVSAMGGKGNLIDLYDIPGSTPSEEQWAGHQVILKKYPNIHVVGGKPIDMASEATAESVLLSLLPSLPPVQGVISDGVGYSVDEAFSHLGRPFPADDYGIDGVSLKMMAEYHATKPGFKAEAFGSPAGLGSAGFWMAVDILHHVLINGKPIPKQKVMDMPNVVITLQNLAAWRAVTPMTNDATWVFTQAETNANMAATELNKPPLLPPVPTKPI